MCNPNKSESENNNAFQNNNILCVVYTQEVVKNERLIQKYAFCCCYTRIKLYPGCSMHWAGIFGEQTEERKHGQRRKIAAVHKKESFKPHDTAGSDGRGSEAGAVFVNVTGTAVAILHPAPRPFVTWLSGPAFPALCVYRILTQTSVSSWFIARLYRALYTHTYTLKGLS